ncbi:TonB-dependent receptor [Undibacterium sp. Jales W-56]|uniref:TonB-dependent receptor n=1 Tax=Undibacterium sp. Jales W-56 TaxID=2897325 RepID=UPI0021D0AF8A|nr:TonB-dependent receptor [Undibacterium sp. Jales W-56]MCU6435566.1 TonB-dependent receptor [Undibacterium sp. Jales W-56]
MLVMSVAMQAQAQEATKTEAGTQEIVVTGIRASLQQSLNQKRNADTYVEVITAEDIGKMPDKNVADSLQRIPGVSVAAAGGGEGSFGENDRVALRGTPFGLTLTTLNGHSVSSGDWFADNIVGGGRSVSFSLFPSELIGRVTVHKGSQASLLEGGAEGVVDIETRKPLDFKKSFNAQASIGLVNSSNSGKSDPQINGLVAWKNDTSTMGVLVQAFHEKRTLSRAGQENQIWWDKVDAGTPIANAVPGAAGAVTSYLGGTAWFEQVRTREGGLIDLQFKPSKDFSLDLTAFHSHLDAPNVNHNFMQSLGRFLAPSWGTNGYPAGAISGSVNQGVVSNLTVANPAGCVPCAGYSSAVQEIFSRPVAESQSDFLNLDGSFRVNDNLTLNGKIGSTKGLGNTVSGAMGIWMPWTGGSYTVNGSDKAVTYVTPGADKFSIGGFNNGAPGTPGAPYTYGSHVTANDKEDYAQLDGIYKTNLASIPTVKFGLRAANHKRDLSSIGNNALPGLSDAANLPMSGLTAFPSIFSDLGANGAGYWTFSQGAVNAWLAKYTSYTGHLLQNEFSIKEPTQSAYAMADFGSEGFSGNFGVRVVRTSEEVTRNEIGASGSFEPRTYKNSYTDFLPSANFRLDVTKDLVARFGVSRTMARPELGQMAGLDLRDVQGTGNGGNPNLKPIRANTVDLGVEWYFAPKSMLSADAFFSALDGYVTYGASSGTFYNQIQKKNTVYAMSTPINTQAEVKGLELAYVQSLAGGFGVNANYTYTLGKETGQAPGSKCGALVAPDCTLIGTSKNAYNLGAFYENDKFSARITYSYRSGFLNGTSRNSAAFQNEIGTLSASLAYQINDTFSITLDGKDLNNPLVSSVWKTPGAADLPASLYKNGRQIYLSLHAKM